MWKCNVNDFITHTKLRGERTPIEVGQGFTTSHLPTTKSTHKPHPYIACAKAMFIFVIYSFFCICLKSCSSLSYIVSFVFASNHVHLCHHIVSFVFASNHVHLCHHIVSFVFASNHVHLCHHHIVSFVSTPPILHLPQARFE